MLILASPQSPPGAPAPERRAALYARIPWVALLLLSAACGTPPAALQQDARAYIARMSEWAAVEGETGRSITRILQSHFVDEAAVLREISDLRPRLDRHLASVDRYTPRTTQVAHIHHQYVAAWRGLLHGFDAIERGFSSGEQSELAAGRTAILRWKDDIRHIASELGELLDETGDPPQAARARPHRGGQALPMRSDDVLLSHMATMQYHRRRRA